MRVHSSFLKCSSSTLVGKEEYTRVRGQGVVDQNHKFVQGLCFVFLPVGICVVDDLVSGEGGLSHPLLEGIVNRLKLVV